MNKRTMVCNRAGCNLKGKWVYPDGSRLCEAHHKEHSQIIAYISESEQELLSQSIVMDDNKFIELLREARLYLDDDRGLAIEIDKVLRMFTDANYCKHTKLQVSINKMYAQCKQCKKLFTKKPGEENWKDLERNPKENKRFILPEQNMKIK